MKEYKIEHDVPVPAHGNNRYPWAEMEPGDSFFVPCEHDQRRKKQEVISSSARGYVKRSGDGKFTTRIVEGGVRIWRIE